MSEKIIAEVDSKTVANSEGERSGADPLSIEARVEAQNNPDNASVILAREIERNEPPRKTA